MRILLSTTASFVPPRGGSTRSNRKWLEELAARGHECLVVCGAPPGTKPEQWEQTRLESNSDGLLIDPLVADASLPLQTNILVEIHRELGRRNGILAQHIERFRPDWVLVSSEDLSHSLLREADETAPGRVVYLAHTPQFFPFGPESWSPDRNAANRVRSAASVVAIGHHVAAYIVHHLGINPCVIHPPIYGAEPFERFSNFDSGFALMVNPCAVKGISIFAELARAMPGVAFASLPGWGTTSRERELLSSLPNHTMLAPVRRIEEALARTCVLLMPSLWHEGFGLIVMEAMLRGIPVIASHSGGLQEAKSGTNYVLPVALIREYRAEWDEVGMPTPVIPQQNIKAWIDALGELRANRVAYESEAERSREAALRFVRALRPAAMEEHLLSLNPTQPSTVSKTLTHRVEQLSPEKRELLLRKHRAAREHS